jgi:hypothetical protein
MGLKLIFALRVFDSRVVTETLCQKEKVIGGWRKKFVLKNFMMYTPHGT